MQTYPQAVRDQFEFLLQAARTGTVLTEDHGYWIDFRSASDMREILLEVGRRLVAADIISDANDFGHLTLAEILAALRGLSGDLHTTVADRRAEMERYRGVDVPFAIGVAPDETPPDDAGGRMMAKFFGARAQASADPAVLHGSAGSAGVVRGPVRIVRSWDEADLVQPGDILVAETTSPPWTPLFSTVAAVVTDTGGVLSHCAVVAREYGIPAVVATGSATRTLSDGQIVEVDGSHGIVRIIST